MKQKDPKGLVYFSLIDNESVALCMWPLGFYGYSSSDYSGMFFSSDVSFPSSRRSTPAKVPVGHHW